VRRRRAAVISVCLFAATILLASPGGQGPAAASTRAVQTALLERAAFGLSADSGDVSRLLHSPADVGSTKWGLPLTGEEEVALDLQGRMSFAQAAGAELLPFVRALPTFGGVYQDQRNEGALVVLLVEANPQIEQQILSLVPLGARAVTIRYVPNTYAELRLAAHRAWGRWAALYPEVRLRAVKVDTMNNRLRLRVDAQAGLLDSHRVRAVRTDLRVPFTLDVGAIETSVACPERDECADSLDAGVIINRGAPGGPRCTMGFHIRIGTNREFLTSGHCGRDGAREWYRHGTLVGRQIATLYRQDGSDVMRVRLSGPGASSSLRGPAGVVAGSDLPIQGQVVCASLGRSLRVDCGTVSSEWVSWTDGICTCTSWGGDVDGIEIRQGDSGSPIYLLHGDGRATAIGLVSTTSGKFAVVADALAHWGATIAP
jgi:hypothetical protein